MAGLVGGLMHPPTIGIRGHGVADFVDVWPEPPEVIRSGILAMGKAASK